MSLSSFLAATFSASLLVTGAAPAAAPMPGEPVKVIHVDDGDTLVALTADNQRIRVRLASIDAPETGHGRCRPGQPFGNKAGEFLTRLLRGKQVRLLCVDTDRYGRAVCDVHSDAGSANRAMVAAGYAWAYRGGAGYVRDKEIYALEDRARADRAGLWKDSQPTAPWVWRKTEWMAPAVGCGSPKVTGGRP